MAQDSLTIAPGASPDDVSRRLERIEQNLDRLASALDQALVTTPHAVATAVDVLDEFMFAVQARGIDIDALIRVGGDALAALAELMQSPQFTQRLSSGALAASSMAVAQASDALAETNAEAGGKAGILRLLRASRDADVQRALDFMLRFMKRFGRGLAEHDQGSEQGSEQGKEDSDV